MLMTVEMREILAAHIYFMFPSLIETNPNQLGNISSLLMLALKGTGIPIKERVYKPVSIWSVPDRSESLGEGLRSGSRSGSGEVLSSPPATSHYGASVIQTWACACIQPQSPDYLEAMIWTAIL